MILFGLSLTATKHHEVLISIYDWLIDRLIDLLFDRLTDWSMIDWSVVWSIDWLFDGSKTPPGPHIVERLVWCTKFTGSWSIPGQVGAFNHALIVAPDIYRSRVRSNGQCDRQRSTGQSLWRPGPICRCRERPGIPHGNFFHSVASHPKNWTLSISFYIFALRYDIKVELLKSKFNISKM